MRIPSNYMYVKVTMCESTHVHVHVNVHVFKRCIYTCVPCSTEVVYMYMYIKNLMHMFSDNKAPMIGHKPHACNNRKNITPTWCTCDMYMYTCKCAQ